jgi:hypothetical protein
MNEKASENVGRNVYRGEMFSEGPIKAVLKEEILKEDVSVCTGYRKILL